MIVNGKDVPRNTARQAARAQAYMGNDQADQVYHAFPLMYPELRNDLIARAAERLRGVEFDTFIGSGFSGVGFGMMLATVMDKNFVLVRKPGESSHSWARVVGVRSTQAIIVDDFIDRGNTIERMLEALKDANYPRPIGIYEAMGPNFSFDKDTQGRWGLRHWLAFDSMEEQRAWWKQYAERPEMRPDEEGAPPSVTSVRGVVPVIDEQAKFNPAEYYTRITETFMPRVNGVLLT